MSTNVPVADLDVVVQSKSRTGKHMPLGLRTGGIIFSSTGLCCNEKLVFTPAQLRTLRDWADLCLQDFANNS